MLTPFNRIYPIELDINSLKEVHFTQGVFTNGDRQTSTIIAKLTKDNAALDLTDATITAFFHCADSEIYKQNTTILDAAGGIVGIDLKADVLIVGRNTMALRVEKPNGDVMYSPFMTFDVVQTILDGLDAHDSLSMIEQILKDLGIAMEEVGKLKDQVAEKIQEVEDLKNAMGGFVSSVTVNGTKYNAVNNNVDLPDYPTLDSLGASPAVHTHSSNQIVDLNGYHNAYMHTLPIRADDSLNIALEKLETGIEEHLHGTNAINELRGYNKGNHKGALTENDNLNLALAKLENGIDDAKNNSLPNTGGNVTGNITAPTFTGDLIGNADTATQLKDARRINGTFFDGTRDIDTQYWGTTRGFKIGNFLQSVNGARNYEWSLDDMGASPKVHTHDSSTIENLNGYNKGNHNGALTTNDSLNIALAKLENGVDDSKKYTDTKVADLVNSAPATLDTLKELADALGNDPNFATTVTNQIGQKADKTYVDNQLANKADVTYVNNQLNGKANAVHTHTSNQVNAMTGYTKPNTTSAIVPGDTLNAAIGKLEKALENKQPAGNFLPLAGGDMTGNINFTVVNKGLTQAGKLYLRNNGTSTVLSSNNAELYLRPGGDTSTTGQVVISTNGNVTAPTFTGNLNGNATTATTLQNTREIRLQGDVAGAVNFNGGANAVITSTLANITRNNTTSAQSPNFGATFTAIDGVTSDAKGRITGVNTKTITLPSVGVTTDEKVKNTPNNTVKAYITGTTTATEFTGTQVFDTNVFLDTAAGHLTATQFNGRLNGNATTATTLQNTRTLTIGKTGKPFNGSQNVSWALNEIIDSPITGNWFRGVPTVTTGGVMEIGKYIDFHNTDATTRDYSTRLQCNGDGGNTVNLPTNGGTLALLTDNVASATKLQTARTIKIGNSAAKPFDGTANLTFTLQEIGATGGGGNFLPLTGGTVTGATTFQAGVTIGNTSRITEQAGGLNISSPSITLGGGDIYIQNPMRFVGHGLSDNDGNWSISQAGIATFKGVNAHNDLVSSGTVTGKNGVGGANSWIIYRDGSATFSGTVAGSDLTGAPNKWTIAPNGNTTFNDIRANGVIYGKNNIALNRGLVWIPQDALGDTVTDHLRIGNMILSSTDNTDFYFSALSGTKLPRVFFANNICLARDTLGSPYVGTPITTDYLRIGGGIMAGVDSGNFHFMTKDGRPVSLYCAGIIQGSDIKLKENIRYIDAPKKTSKDIKDDTITKDELFNFIKNLKVCEYNYIESDNDKIGFIANDIVGDKVGDKILLENGGVLSYDTSNMLFATIGALQEEIEKRENLEKENNELKDRLEKIEKALGI